MAGLLHLRLEIDGDVQVSRQLGVLLEHVKDLRPAWRRIHQGQGLPGGGQSMVVATREHFASHGARGGARWPELAERTVRERNAMLARGEARFGGRRPILRRTDRMFQSLVARTAGPDTVLEMHPHWMLWGTSVPYAGFHQRGAGVPRRRPVQPTEADKRSWVKTIQAYLVETGELRGARRSIVAGRL